MSVGRRLGSRPPSAPPGLRRASRRGCATVSTGFSTGRQARRYATLLATGAWSTFMNSGLGIWQCWSCSSEARLPATFAGVRFARRNISDLRGAAIGGSVDITVDHDRGTLGFRVNRAGEGPGPYTLAIVGPSASHRFLVFSTAPRTSTANGCTAKMWQ